MPSFWQQLTDGFDDAAKQRAIESTPYPMQLAVICIPDVDLKFWILKVRSCASKGYACDGALTRSPTSTAHPCEHPHVAEIHGVHAGRVSESILQARGGRRRRRPLGRGSTEVARVSIRAPRRLGLTIHAELLQSHEPPAGGRLRLNCVARHVYARVDGDDPLSRRRWPNSKADARAIPSHDAPSTDYHVRSVVRCDSSWSAPASIMVCSAACASERCCWPCPWRWLVRLGPGRGPI